MVCNVTLYLLIIIYYKLHSDRPIFADGYVEFIKDFRRSTSEKITTKKYQEVWDLKMIFARMSSLSRTANPMTIKQYLPRLGTFERCSKEFMDICR